MIHNGLVDSRCVSEVHEHESGSVVAADRCNYDENRDDEPASVKADDRKD